MSSPWDTDKDTPEQHHLALILANLSIDGLNLAQGALRNFHKAEDMVPPRGTFIVKDRPVQRTAYTESKHFSSKRRYACSAVGREYPTSVSSFTCPEEFLSRVEKQSSKSQSRLQPLDEKPISKVSKPNARIGGALAPLCERKEKNRENCLLWNAMPPRNIRLRNLLLIYFLDNLVLLHER
uniref:Uncharacterized protein n=1 Tax=Timema cristinae TaxID=61476 RepID=A0A7R9CPW0_TIMCR|nr:unnamed protein product [Timema cristinae]